MRTPYTPFSLISEEPEKYSKKWVKSLAKLKTRPYRSSHSGGDKYLIDLDSSNENNIKLTIWESPPSWIDYNDTSDYLLNIFCGTDDENLQIRRLFQAGETVFFEGYLNFWRDVAWINIERILIISPSIAIGPREIIGMISCPRKYYLDYVKNVGGNILKWPDLHITRGKLVHSIIERVVSDGTLFSLSNYDIINKKTKIKELIDEQLEGKYKLDATLHILAKTPLEDVIKDVMNRLTSAFSDQELFNFLDGNQVGIECEINRFSGFTGIADFMVNGEPTELKTSTYASDDHIIQLKVYILANYLNNGIRKGHLIYTTNTSISDENSSKIHHITISDYDIDQIIYARHKVLLQRNKMILPDTLNKNCEGCQYNITSEYPLKKVWPPCQYYCQTERHWKCYEIDKQGTITNTCPLVENCPVRDHYFDIKAIDHFNKMRKAIMAENEEYSHLPILIRDLPYETLYACGQIVKDLRLESIKSNICKLISEDNLPCLDLSPGDQITINSDNNLQYTAILLEIGINHALVRFYTNPEENLFQNSLKYTIKKDYHENQKMRSLLKTVDHIQRTIRHPVSEISKGKLSDRFTIKEYDSDNVVAELEKKRLVAIQANNQFSTIKSLSDITEKLPRPCKVLLVLKDDIEIQEFIKEYQNKHELLIIDRDRDFETGVQTIAISDKNTPEQIVEKINLSSVFITRQGFIRSSYFFELLHLEGRKTSFNYILVSAAEEYFEPEIHYLRGLGFNTLLTGDAYRACQRIKSKEARDLGLEISPFSQMVKYDAYFISDDYSIFCKNFNTLPEQIPAILSNTPIKISATKQEGLVSFIEVDGDESGIENVTFRNSISVLPCDNTLYRIVLTPLKSISISKLDDVVEYLKKTSLEQLSEKNVLKICDVSFYIKERYSLGLIPESGENIDLWIEIPVQFSETLEELMFSNEKEANKVLETLLKIKEEDRGKCAIITPFISQATLIKNLLYQNNQSNVDVLLPHQIRNRSYETTIISFVCSGHERILRYPLNKIEVIYSILTSAKKELILIGNEKTLCQNRLLSDIINSPNTLRR